MKKTAPKEYSILQKYPQKVLNNTTTKTLGNTEAPIEVFPPEIFFKGKLSPLTMDSNLRRIRY